MRSLDLAGAACGTWKASKFSRKIAIPEPDITPQREADATIANMSQNARKTARAGHYSDNVRLAKKPNKKGTKRRVRKLPPYLTIAEKDRFFAAISSPRDRALFRLLYHHGLRVSEPHKLELTDYRAGSRLELDRIYLHRLKGSVSGECVMVESAALAMRAWLRIRGHAPGPLFPSRQKGPLSRKRIWELMQKYCLAAGIPPEKAHPHAFKHSCCTHLISDQKESIMDVRNHVGHRDIKSTMIYAVLLDGAGEERSRRLRKWR